MMYDLFAKIFTEEFDKGSLENEIRKIWEKICDEYNSNKWKKEFRKEFLNFIKSILNDYPLFLQFKLLKLYEILEEDLENLTKVLEKRVGRKIHRPEIPSAKEIYKDIILSSPDIKVAVPLFSNNSSFLNGLPRYATLIETIFTLRKPYLSKDDDSFYVIDNPIVKDKVFKLPMIRSTTWKGALRFAFRQVCNNSDIEKRLFGNKKGETENFKQGRLFFYSTFFDEISLDVITPLSRETKTPVRGRAPIYFEMVPENVKGIFRLLYYPYDLIAKGEFDKIGEEVKEDFRFLAKAIHKMFHEMGFSAKKTSGFGTAEIIDVKVLYGEKLKEYESSIQKIFEKNLREGVSDD